MASTRVQYDSDDDTLLVKYLAKYNPGVQGRKGNKVYQTLTLNADKKWAWASRHPWGGWRERYMKHQAEFDQRIKKYQIRKNLPTANPGHVNGTKKTVDSEIESDTNAGRKRKYVPSTIPRKKAKAEQREEEEEDEPAPEILEAVESSSESSEASQIVPNINIYPSLDSVAKPHPAKPRPLIPRSTIVDNDFVSLPPTPADTVSRPPTTASNKSEESSSEEDDPRPPMPRRLARIDEGPFRSKLAVGKPHRKLLAEGDSDSDDQAGPWPPIRSSQQAAKGAQLLPAKAHTIVKKPFRKLLLDSDSDDDATPNRSQPPKPSPAKLTPSANRKPRSPRPGQPVFPKEQKPAQVVVEKRKVATGHIPQVNAIASSSKVHLTPAKPPPLGVPNPPKGRKGLQPVVGITKVDTSRIQRVNAVASSSKVQLTPAKPFPLGVSASPKERNAAQAVIEKPDVATSRIPQVNAITSSSKVTPAQPHRSTSPLDWGSPIGGHSPTPRTPTSPFDLTTLLTPEDEISSHDAAPAKRHPLRNLAQPNQPPQKLFFAGRRSRNEAPRSVISEHESTRRSRAPSPNTDANSQRYQLPSPPRASLSRQHPRSPLSGQGKRTSQFESTFSRRINNNRLLSVVADHDVARRRSLPAIDFHKKTIVMPRQSLPAPQHRRVSAPQPRGPRESSIFPTRASLGNSPDEDTAVNADLSAQVFVAMAKNHGFGVDVVRNLFARTRNLEKTDALLLRLREKSEAAVEAMLQEEDDQPPPPVLAHRRNVSGSSSVRTPQSGAFSVKYRSSSRRRSSRLPDDEVFRPKRVDIDSDDVLEYTPPSGSRAAALVRPIRKSREFAAGLSASMREAKIDRSGGSSNSSHQPKPLPAVDMEDLLKGDISTLRELEQQDMDVAVEMAEKFARYILEASE
ncbi:Myb-DNA-bind-2 domain-containing protein [Mycena indigotica]|uniref:Myb-DNA-bind-2 domain-containing protein n=1 Tax=Mycena indigotica TaxID=2126181 RepID=A0A8H6W315_9AGAR|nr:Myb-DNA-bind-2 domain-containing protein [Mycena indigotica]KAF7301051.1 Myb-DNA-bind-2 domain-containing protein [Mycena indigotica]